MLVGAAKVLSDRRDVLRGRFRFMFQPGEEGSGGAALMVSEGVLEGVDAAFALHVAPNLGPGWLALRAGPMLAATDDFEITVHGRGGQAAARKPPAPAAPVACQERVLDLRPTVNFGGDRRQFPQAYGIVVILPCFILFANLMFQVHGI